MTSTSTSRRTISGKYILLFFPILAVVSFVATYTIVALSTPQNSPKAQMFRTEATLRSLANAIETYRADLGAYPPAGEMGLSLATAYLSKTVNYLPEGPPQDAWNHSYYYVPSDAYQAPGSVALKLDEKYLAPTTYQLYSAGIDGDPGIEDPRKRADNISSWDSDRAWRAKYYHLQQAYFESQVHANE
ncbi:MAG: type II secretion system protein GspG [Candidatus Hydrogenedentes bacterium]|nr:type II secretion system protein GspG [Candidatus Hydrogenedentota bacterium]